MSSCLIMRNYLLKYWDIVVIGSLTLYRAMEFPIKFEDGPLYRYVEGSQVIISKTIFFSLNMQTVQTLMKCELCGISSGLRCLPKMVEVFPLLKFCMLGILF